MYPTDEAVTIAPTAASHRKIAVAEGPDSIPSICAVDGLFASHVSGRVRLRWALHEPAVSPRQKHPALISSSLHLGQRCSAMVPDGQTSSTEATKRLRRRRKLQQSLALRRQSPFQTRGKERLRRHSLQPPSLAS